VLMERKEKGAGEIFKSEGQGGRNGRIMTVE
jgi:hypothetical protein